MNAELDASLPAKVLAGVTFLRRGGDRCNAYNWETNLSNGSAKTGYANDMYLAKTLTSPNAPGELDRELIASDLAAGRGTMLPFVLNDYVAGVAASNIPYTSAGFRVDAFFHRVQLVKPTPFATTPDPTDGVVYTDENLAFLRRQFPGDIYAPGATQVMVGSDNEPDLYESNFPMLQRGSGDPVYLDGVQVGNRLTAADFTARYIRFATRVKELEPAATMVGPDHFNFDGYTNFHTPGEGGYTDDGRWYMDDFLAAVRDAGTALGKSLIDTWDFHWYPQRQFGGTFTWMLDDSTRPMTADETDAVLQGPRSYWDPDYDEHSWITDDHLHGPAYILTRLRGRIDAADPGIGLGVTEYFPGGCSHVSSGLAVADTLGVFGRMGIHMAAMWPHTCDLGFAFGGFELLRNADGHGLAFDATSTTVEHPEKAESSIYAASDASAHVTLLVINKTASTRRFGLRIFNNEELHTVDAYRIDASHADPTHVDVPAPSLRNALVYEAPAMSATLLVLRGS